jgi:hypothetical protein
LHIVRPHGITISKSQLGGADMGIRDHAVTTLLISGTLVGALYAGVLTLAFRWLGVRGGMLISALALVLWASLLVRDPGHRYRTASWILQVDLLVLILAISTLPAFVIHRVRNRAAGALLRQAAYGLGSFYLAVAGSLGVGVVLLLVARWAGG